MTGVRSTTDLKLEHAGNVYITDQRTDTVKKLDSRGNQILSWGAGQFNNPMGLSIDPAGDPTGNVYVVDQDNQRIQKFSPNGSSIAIFG